MYSECGLVADVDTPESRKPGSARRNIILRCMAAKTELGKEWHFPRLIFIYRSKNCDSRNHKIIYSIDSRCLM